MWQRWCHTILHHNGIGLARGPIDNIRGLIDNIIKHWFEQWVGTKPLPKATLTMYHDAIWPQWVNTLRPRQDGRHFADDVFTCIFFNENCCILIKFSLKYVRKGPIDNNPALVQITAWRRPGDKPLSEPMMVSLPTHICVTRPQWVKSTFFIYQNWQNNVVYERLLNGIQISFCYFTRGKHTNFV